MDFRRLVTSEFSAPIERLVAAMEAEVAAMTKQIQATADTGLAEAAVKVEQLTSTLTQARANEQQLVSTVDQLRHEAKELKTALAQTQAEKQTVDEAFERASADVNSLRATIAKIEADHASRRETMDRAVQKIRDRVAAREGELEKIAAAKAAAEAELQNAQTAWSAEIRAVHEAHAAAVAADVEYLRRAFTRLQQASTVKGAIQELATCLADIFPRVVLFDVNTQRLEGRWQTGFNLGQEISTVVVPLTKETAFNAVVQSGQPSQLSVNDLRNLPKPFAGGSPSLAVVLPVVIDGATGAVVYVDDSGRTGQALNPQRAAGAAEILLLHTMPLVARLAAHEKDQAYEAQLLNQFQIV